MHGGHLDFLVSIYSVPDCPNVMRIAWDKVYKVFKTKEKEKLIISIVIIILLYITVQSREVSLNTVAFSRR